MLTANYYEQISKDIGKNIEFDEDGNIVTDLTEQEKEYILFAIASERTWQYESRCQL